ncbi:hypothetical protein Goshw_021943 [Gossypium schwendimanii]|uniref:Uncharacterized protein n=1 Tax=Gossypium schwendimanii TaxID=34291 RepID=A0A7J9L4R0_GOSSC|nr:hypothetical protein [Gossypium schwendimanii]
MGSRNGGGAPTMIRRRQSDFKMSFNLALRSLLTTCSKEVGTALDTVGQLVEEQCLDHFFSDKWVSIWFLTLSECWVLN